DVLVHGGQRVELQPFTDFLEGGRVLMLLHEAVNELVNFLLLFGERHCAPIVGEQKAKCQCTSGYSRCEALGACGLAGGLRSAAELRSGAYKSGEQRMRLLKAG